MSQSGTVLSYRDRFVDIAAYNSKVRLIMLMVDGSEWQLHLDFPVCSKCWTLHCKSHAIVPYGLYSLIQ